MDPCKQRTFFFLPSKT